MNTLNDTNKNETDFNTKNVTIVMNSEHTPYY